MQWLCWRHGWLSIIIVLAMSMVGCGPRPGASQGTLLATDHGLVVDLPALYIDYDVNGVAYVGKTPLRELGAGLGKDLAILNLDPNWITRLTAANIQHLQLLNRPGGVIVLVNGQSLPSLGWDKTKLLSTAHLFQSLSGGASFVEELTPLVGDLGMGLVVRFPLAATAPPVPLGGEPPSAEVIAAASVMSQTQTTQAAYLAVIGAPPQLALTITYATDGTWTLSNLSAAGWTQAVAAPWSRLDLPVTLVQKISAAGIKTITVASTQQGVRVTVNEQMLPELQWDANELQRLVDLVHHLGLFDTMLAKNPNPDVIVETLQQLLPFVQTLEVTLVINFP